MAYYVVLWHAGMAAAQFYDLVAELASKPAAAAHLASSGTLQPLMLQIIGLVSVLYSAEHGGTVPLYSLLGDGHASSEHQFLLG